MAAKSAKASLSHEERTVEEPRNEGLHPVILNKITRVNDRIQLYKLLSKNRTNIEFLAGQWVDLHVPGVEKAGGFTIASSPRDGIADSHGSREPFVELAVQKSPENPAAAWLWQPDDQILGTELKIRIGGSFVWPPKNVDRRSISRVVLIAGGVGINPLISMLQDIQQEDSDLSPLEVEFLYSTKLPTNSASDNEVLFLQRLLDWARSWNFESGSRSKGRLDLFFTGTWDGSSLTPETTLTQKFRGPRPPHTHGNSGADVEPRVSAQVGRIDEAALRKSLGDERGRSSSVFYVCGPPDMTDGIVDWLQQQDGISPAQVMCEKWW
ncbi:hypothetical protein BU24DRAFT_337384 [Aaosphaeria arxii CBS 175.79]|uniref:FAD-binding FR-type domain-containing protein n=1 Tax=Aaosphaeria arxii CBS 175.79 TaxID=1450172 RepID=A0A6A5Y7U3_9PLEO|nr:uncharacterized protein BU24DRAFT_337384 [Aaosphaeria arxii CBS 175.79]KAF2021642.1 hypothetical protein BU24DRAFT_337384 [Aaosphaeria arxii CBS 175.79]